MMNVRAWLVLVTVCLWCTMVAGFSSSDYRAFDDADDDWGSPPELHPEDIELPIYSTIPTEEEDKNEDRYQARRAEVLARTKAARERLGQKAPDGLQEYCADMMSARHDHPSGASEQAYRCVEYYKKQNPEDIPKFMREHVEAYASASEQSGSAKPASEATPEKPSQDNDEALKPDTESSPTTPVKPPPSPKGYNIVPDYLHVDLSGK